MTEEIHQLWQQMSTHAAVPSQHSMPRQEHLPDAPCTNLRPCGQRSNAFLGAADIEKTLSAAQLRRVECHSSETLHSHIQMHVLYWHIPAGLHRLRCTCNYGASDWHNATGSKSQLNTIMY